VRFPARLLLGVIAAHAVLGVGSASAAARPHVAIGPDPGAYSNLATVSLQWTANFKPVRVLCTFDERELSCRNGSVTLHPATGSHVVQVTAWRANGAAVSARRRWTTDLIAPGVPTVSGAPTTTDAPWGWVNHPVTLTAGSTDQRGSGVGDYWILRDGWAKSEAQTVTVTREGSTEIQFAARDRAHNVSGWTAPIPVSIDMTPPQLSLACSDEIGGWDTGPVLVLAKATDGLSGLADIEYETSSDGVAWSAPEHNSAYVATADGTSYVRFRATDRAGNTSDWTQREFVVDDPLPTVTVTGGSTAWSATPVTITATASDPDVPGRLDIQHETSVDGGTTWSDPAWGGSVVVSDTGTTLVRFRARDCVLMWSDWTIPDADTTAAVDQTAPEVRVSGGSAPWSTGPVKVTASATDTGSGVAGYRYETGGPGAWSAPQPGDSVTISADGVVMVRFAAYDAVGNVSPWIANTASSAYVYVDATPPTLTTPYGAGEWMNGTSGVITYADDATSGLAGVEYETSTDGGDTWSDPQPGHEAWISREGITEVRFRASDQAGNVTPWTTPTRATTTMIDDTPPTLRLSSTQTGSTVTVTADVSDSGSGTEYVLYDWSDDGGMSWAGHFQGASVQVPAGPNTIVRFEAIDNASNVTPWVTLHL
jgi:Big-like domain-containing protein